MTRPTAVSAGVDALQAALAAEHEAVWTYALVGARHPTLLDGEAVPAAAYRVHRRRRNRAVLFLRTLGVEPVGSAAVVDVPEVGSAAAAVALGGLIERRCIARWAAAIAPTAGASRELAVTMLGDTAVTALPWGVAPSALPGLP